MSRAGQAVQEFHKVDIKTQSNRKRRIVHPVSQIIVTIIYIITVVSFDKYDITGLLSMIIYPILTMIWNDISIREGVRRIWPVLLLSGIVGIANPFFDRTVFATIGTFSVTYGMISMITFMLKGILSVWASYLLVMMTGIDEICYGLRCLHIPKEIVTVVMLIYRYIIVMLKEVERMMQAYRLRACGQRGIHMKDWGAFVGQLFLRSVDRAETVYESMLLRGYRGNFVCKYRIQKKWGNVVYAVIWIFVFLILRIFPVFQIAGSIRR